jgi:YVTN family beta-propeller protein
MTRPYSRTLSLKSGAAVALVALLSACGMLITSADDAIQPRFGARPITPAGALVADLTTRQPAVGALTVDFVRSPDRTGPQGGGRYLVAVNSGFGVQFNSSTNRAQQSLSVIDLNAKPGPAVVQNVFFPSPQSVNVGVAFSPVANTDGSFSLYASGGFENKIWIFTFRPGARQPLWPASPGPGTRVEAPFVDVSGFTFFAPTPNYNDGAAPVYPAGIAVSPDGGTLYVANNLGDSVGIIERLPTDRPIKRVDLRRDDSTQFIYPYGVVAVPGEDGKRVSKVYVSCWGDASIAVIDPAKSDRPAARIAVDRHPTAMILSERRGRLYVVNSDADSVSVIDTASDREIERINVKLSEASPVGASPESLALSADGATLYVANAHSNSIAVVALSPMAMDRQTGSKEAATTERGEWDQTSRSRVRGFIPTGYYPAAVAVVGHSIFLGNGKGTGFESSSMVANNSGRMPNMPNDRFPTGTGRGSRGGQHVLSLVSGNISLIAEPDERELAAYTQQVMRNDGLLGSPRTSLFNGPSPIKHVIYIIKENRTYDQVFGDMARSGNGNAADGDPSLAIFGAGEAAQLPGGPAQDITPNQHALALRFGLLDRFFVNADASPDGHNWSTAAFSSDYTDKAYRWSYSNRGRTYDFEGFNRLQDYEPAASLPPVFRLPTTAGDIADYVRRFIPYLNGARDIAEPETLYLWDAAARAGLSYRNYGEFVATISEADVAAINNRKSKAYPDTSPTITAIPTKKSLENHHSTTFPSFDLDIPDSMTVDSYRAARESNGALDPVISRTHADSRFRGVSRLGEWLAEFRDFVTNLEAGRGDRMPNFSMLRFPTNHTVGIKAGAPTPQFCVAENDYAVGLLVEAVSASPYWKDTAIFIVEDDAQDGPDHVDAHRSPALVISAYNRPGALVHQFHSTVSLIRTMEILLGMGPMNQLDATAAPIDIFSERADLRPYKAVLPEVALSNLLTPPARDARTAYWMKRTAEQDLSHADMADPRVLNHIIWFSVKGEGAPMPGIARLPAFDAIREGLAEARGDNDDRSDDGRAGYSLARRR